MYCNLFLDPYCVSGCCPKAVYDEYGPDYADNIPCDECNHTDGICEDCVYQHSEYCPLEYVLAEAVSFYIYDDLYQEVKLCL